MTVDRLERRQDCDPRRHPTQTMSAQQLTDPLGDSGIQWRGLGHPSSITQPMV
jgi:hypothetical protein